jgi:hypothetical protein
MRIKNALLRATVIGVCTTVAGVGPAVTATPASARPAQCTAAQIEQLQHDEGFWEDEAVTWEDWAAADSENHDWQAYGYDRHNAIVATEQAEAAVDAIGACL